MKLQVSMSILAQYTSKHGNRKKKLSRLFNYFFHYLNRYADKKRRNEEEKRRIRSI